MKLKKTKLPFKLDIINSDYIVCSDSEYIHTNLYSRPNIETDKIAIIQIAAIKINMSTGEYTEFNELINPGEWSEEYWDVCTRVTKKEKKDHIDCLDFNMVFDKFLKFIADYPVVVMNQDVDIYRKLGKTVNNTVIKLKPLIPLDCASGELCKELGFELANDTPHDGLFDAINIGTVIYSSK